MYHQPVLLQSVCDLLGDLKGKLVFDATLGGGGHTKAFLDLGASVIGVDQDHEAIDHVNQSAAFSPALATGKLILVNKNFSEAKAILAGLNLADVDVFFADLGVSSHQFDTPSRGFSFRQDGPLDMRMDQKSPTTAMIFLSQLNVESLAQTLGTLGEIKNSKQIAEKILSKSPIYTTQDLFNAIGDKNIAPQVFQALRIAVNNELVSLEKFIFDAFEILNSGGKMAIISFHSLEDRLVKKSFSKFENTNRAKILTPNPITPSESEIDSNPRSRSSKLRVIKKL